MREAITAGGTVAQVFSKLADAEDAAKRLRGFGFADVRLSERAGATTEAHVPEEAGRTETDFAGSLEQAGFGAEDARRLTHEVARGGTLLTVAAGDRVADAEAALRGEPVAARPLLPADALDPAPAAAPAAAPPPLGEGDRVVQLREEQLDVTTQRETSEARVHKEVVTENRTITVPVRREELVIERDGEEPVRIPVKEEPAGPGV